jgi:hypothetical protein
MLSKRAVKAGCGGAGAAMIGCSAEQGARLIYLTINALHAVLGQKTRPENEKRASVFTSLWSVRNIEAVFYKLSEIAGCAACASME